MLGVALALSASLAWGASDFLGGLASRRIAVVAVLLPSQTIALALIAIAVVGSAEPPPALRYIALAAAAGTAATIGLAAFYRGMQIGDISIVAPISATAVVIPVVVGLSSGDRVSTLQCVGIVAAIAGIVLASQEPTRLPGQRRAVVAGTGYGLIAALGIGTFFVTMNAASDGSLVWASLVHRAASVGLIAVAVAVVRRPSDSDPGTS